MTKKQRRKGRFVAGEVASFEAMCNWIDNGNWCMWHNKPLHFGFVISMSFATVRRGYKAGILKPAVWIEDIEKEPCGTNNND